MGRSPLHLLSVAALLMAGCVGDDASPGQPAQPDGGQVDAGGGLLPPTWAVGHYWTYQGSDGGSPTLVVTDDAGGDWIVDTDEPEMAFFDARTDISFLGPVRKDDLAGSQDSQRVAYIDWPLEDGKTWSMTLDGAPFTMQAVRQGDGVFLLQAKDGEAVRHEFVYDAAVAWFREWRFGIEGGTPAFSLTLQDHGDGFQGTPVRYRLEHAVMVDDEPGPVLQEIFDVPEGLTDVWAGYTITCTGAGLSHFAVGPADPVAAMDSGVNEAIACPTTSPVTGEGAWPPAPGTWGFVFVGAEGPPSARLTLDVYLRTLEPVAMGG